MDVREKLVELICRFCSGLAVSDITPPYGYENLADFMISNGVTVQEWIPVTERTPKIIGLYLVIEKHWLDGSLGTKIAKWNTVEWFTADRKSKEITPRVTHWMPLPKPPKGE